MEKLDRSFWQDRRAEMAAAAATRGFVATQSIPEVLRQKIKGFDFAFYTPDDMASRQSVGWVPVRPHQIDATAANEALRNVGIAMKYGLHVAGDTVRYNELILCAMPTDFHKEIGEQINRKSEELFNRAVRTDAVEKTRGIIGEESVATEFEERQITLEPPEKEEPAPKKRGPGRPRKTATDSKE